MREKFPAAVPEIPVSHLNNAIAWYKTKLGFDLDWGGEHLIAGISKGDCRLFLTDDEFRGHYHNQGPVLIWINLGSIEEVKELYSTWSTAGAGILSPPESKSYGLYEFTAVDPDGNLLRVFHDFAAGQAQQI